MEQKSCKKSGLFNALRFWTDSITSKSCFKKKGSKFKLRSESSHCNFISCGNHSNDIQNGSPVNTSGKSEKLKNSMSEPIIDGVRDSSENQPSESNLSDDSSVSDELSPCNDSGSRVASDITTSGCEYSQPLASHHQSQERSENSEASTGMPSQSTNCSLLKSSETQLLVSNEIPSYGGETQNQLDSNLKSGLMNELLKLSKCGWYWGNISKVEAEEKLTDQPDGAFLLRDSSDDHFLLSLSFRSSGKTLHTRIEYSLGRGHFSFYQQTDESFSSIAELIEHSMFFSKSAVYCYSRPRSPGHPSFPVRLTKPVSRFANVRSLQHLCRFVIRESIRLDNIQKLPLPPSIKGYIEEGHY